MATEALLRRVLPEQQIRRLPGLTGLRGLIQSESWHPDLVVLLQGWPDQYPQADVLELLSLAPMARLVCVYSPWCDSDGRTRSAVPLAARVPADGAARRIARELAILRRTFAHSASAAQPAMGWQETSSTAPLPLTASRAEILAFELDEPPPPAVSPRRVRIDGPDRALTRMLAASLSRAGHLLVDAEDSALPHVVLFDADPWGDAQRHRLRQVRGQGPQFPSLIAAVGFSRPDLAEELRAAGADEVWFKLRPLDSLLALL
ncbi:MAG: hypothetical protein ACKV0T_04275 [Planctomycetales bacterium]